MSTNTINKPENSLPYHIRGAFRGFETALARYLKTKNIPLSHFYILRLEWINEGYPQKHLADKAFMTESVASQVIKAMEKNGIVRRTQDPNDSRKKLVCLTPQGLELRQTIVLDGIGLSKAHSPNISKEDFATTMRVLTQVSKAFDIYNSEYTAEK